MADTFVSEVSEVNPIASATLGLRRFQFPLRLWLMLLVGPEFQHAFQRLGLTSCELVVRHFAAAPTSRAPVTVKATVLATPDGSSVSVFFKQYDYSTPAWNFIGRRSKARCEFENYDAFARLGIPAATAVACGEERDRLGRLRRAFIITRAIPEALTLIDFVRKRCADRRDIACRNLRDRLTKQLAEMTRRIHAAHFSHHDLVWRNILVTHSPNAEPQLWWIDCPRGRFVRWARWRRGWRLRDLASLDKVGSELGTRGERLRFVKLYLGQARLETHVKELARTVLKYRETRWAEDEN